MNSVFVGKRIQRIGDNEGTFLTTTVKEDTALHPFCAVPPQGI
jgi:hypothetical protein